jgi:hypothetical protein
VFQPINQHVQAGGEALVAVVDPDVLAEGDQGGEAVGRQRAEELVQLGSDGWVADALFVDRGWGGADGKADGVVDQQGEGKAGLAVGEPGGMAAVPATPRPGPGSGGRAGRGS